ncbi:SEC-C metal-binding domain-containing protein [Methylomonas sp. CM2]|uniref:YecA family protein n=1 Tax=Methylomonas sp. CM2 TaxID=3417647 RepID=UPI003CF9A1CD
MQQELARQYPAVVKEIDELVDRIVSAVQRLPAEQLLHRAWTNLLMSCQHIEVEVDVGMEDAHAMRMVDYVQSIIAASPPSLEQQDEVSEEDWQYLSVQVQKLFQKINFEYHICATAKRKLSGDDFDDAMETFLFKSQMHWCNVRGDNYQVHQVQSLADLLIPQSDIIHRAFGISGEDLIAELEKIWHSLTFGVQDAMESLRSLQLEVMDDVQLLLEDGVSEKGKSIPELMQISCDRLGCREELENSMSSLFGMTLFDVGRLTNLPTVFLEEFSWMPGQDQEFLAAGEFKGWPLRIWPTFKRPFIKLGGHYYCFDIHSLFDNFFRQIEKKIYLRSEAEKQTWIAGRKTVSEALPIQYFERLLPGATVYPEVYYQSQANAGGSKKWCEADCLILFDDHLFVIEVKAGAFTYTSPATDLPAYISSLKALVQSPVEQGQRFVKYLQGSEEVPIFDVNHREIAKLRKRGLRVITICAVTLDSFTEIAAQAQHLHKIGVNVSNDPIWSLSLSDLRVYADIFQGPLEFLHFVEQRMLAAISNRLELDDELDHLGLYLEHNNYSMHAENCSKDKLDTLRYHGYRSEVDRYFSKKLIGETTPVLPVQKMPPRLREVLTFLNLSSIPGRSNIASYLLDLSGDWREKLFHWIETELNDLPSRGRCLPMSTHGEVRLTIFVSMPNVTQYDRANAIHHVRTVLISTNDPDRSLLELSYDNDGTLIGLDWSIINLEGLSVTERDRLKQAGEKLKEKRITNAIRSSGKIGRNELCPCGSGKKFKRCCGFSK